jgi:hypothetical protein
MIMLRRTILCLLTISSATVIAQTDDTFGFCQEALEKYTICLLDTDYSGNDVTVDDDACTACFFNFFVNSDAATNCTEVTDEICSQFDDCNDACFPEGTICKEEIVAYFTCSFGPENCLIQCDGLGPGSGGSGNNSGDDENNPSDSTSDGPTSKLMTLSITPSIILLVAGLLL